MRKLVLDVDGIIVDILSPVEDYLHKIASSYLKTGEADYEMKKLSQSEIENMATFNILDCHDWSFAPFPSYLTKRIKQAFNILPELYSEPMPMYDTMVRTMTSAVLTESNYSEVHYDGCSQAKPVSFKQWHSFIEFLLGYFDIEFHTHVYEAQNATLRRHWLEETFHFANTSGSVTYTIDVGATKDVMEGDVVVEDCLANLFNCKAAYRVLHGMPYNTVNRGNNFQIWQSAGSPSMQVYGTFTELCDCLFRLISKLYNVDLFLVKKAYWEYINELKETNT